MKNLALLILLFSAVAFSQNKEKHFCGSDELHFKQISNNEKYKQKWEIEQAKWQKKESNFKPYFVKDKEQGRLTPPPAILSVVFHDMTSATNPTTSNYQTIVTALNTIYEGGILSPMIFENNTRPDKAAGQNTFIQFCLAQKDINGDPYPLDQSRRPSVPTINLAFPATISDVVTTAASLPRFPTRKYINIYIVDDIAGAVAGFASMPSSHGSNTDGIFVERQFLSDFDPSGTNLNYNMNVLAHEMGHYLGLFHVFGICNPDTINDMTVGGYNPCSCDNGNCLFNGDMVCDTPPSMLLDNPYLCGAPSNTCATDVTAGGQLVDGDDDKANYMDYGNWHCESHFTDGQIERMHFMIDPTTGPRSSLLGESVCVNCTAMANCQITIDTPIALAGNVSIIGNSIAFSPALAGCSAGVNYSWSLVSLGNTNTVVATFAGTNYTEPGSLAVGNYELTLTATSTANINCFERATYRFAVIPVAGSCNLSLPGDNSNWGDFGRVSYQGGWTRQNGTFAYTYPTTVRSEPTDTATFDGVGFDIINGGTISDPNFVGPAFNFPAGVTSVMRVGRVLNNGASAPQGNAYYVSYTFHVSRENARFRIWSLGMREAQNSLNIQYDKFNMNFSPENAAAFGYVCQYNFTSPIAGANPATVGMTENSTLNLQTNGAFPLYGLNDMVSERHNNASTNFVQQGNFRRMTGWNSQILDFSEFADVNADITITFFAHSNNAMNALFSAYSYFGIECLGGGIPADLTMDLPDMSVSCGFDTQSCATVTMPVPAYAPTCMQNFGMANNGSFPYAWSPFGSMAAFRWVGGAWVQLTSGGSVNLSCPNARFEYKLCLSAADAPFEDFQIRYVTLNKTINQNVRVYSGFYHQTPPCPGNAPYGGIVDPVFHPTNETLWCPNTPLPTLHATNPCFPQDNYEYLWTHTPPQYISTGVTTPEYTLVEGDLNPSGNQDHCSKTFVRRVRLIDPYCATPRWVDSGFFTVYNAGGFNYTSNPTTEDICLNGDDTTVEVTISNLTLTKPNCIPAGLMDTATSTITVQLLTTTNQPIGQSHQFNIANFNAVSASTYLIDNGSPTILSFNNIGPNGPIFNVGVHYLNLQITSVINGCEFIKTYVNYISFIVKPAAVGGMILLSDNNCSDSIFTITSPDPGVSNGNLYAWEVASSSTGPFFGLSGAGTGSTLTNYNFASLTPPIFIRRKSFGIGSCSADAYSNVVQINPATTVTTPVFTFQTQICSTATAPVFPLVSNNGIAGSWSPNVVSTTAGATYTFTPGPNQCATTTTVTTTIISNIPATFNLLASYCENNLPVLPSTSLQGITGTWTPAAVTQSGDYVFHPDNGQCGSDVTRHIDVVPVVVPTFTFATTYCKGQTAAALPTTSTNGVVGSWVPAAINTTTVGTFPYVFTATVNGSCRTVTVNVTINPATAPVFNFETFICEGVTPPLLPTTSNNGVEGSWSPATVNGTTSGDYTFTPTSTCSAPLTVHISIATECEFTMTWGSDVGCEYGNTAIKLDQNIEGGPCIKVCENSKITYVIHGNTSLIASTQWLVSGGTVTTHTNTQAVIQWGTTVFSNLQVVLSLTDGTQKTYTICIEKINAPNVRFGIRPQIDVQTYYTCAEIPIFFENLSTSNAGNGTLYYNWNFGDGTTSTEFEPEHTYMQPGEYEVTLVVYNGCSCSGKYSMKIAVAKPSIKIECPGVVCEDEAVTYTIWSDAQRCEFEWTVDGGTVGQFNGNHSEGTIIWDHVDQDGFGYISIVPHGCHDCKTTAKIPVVQQVGTIKGSSTMCMKDELRYSLPQWPSTIFNWSIIDNGTGATIIPQIQGNQILVKSHHNGQITLNCSYTNTLLGCSGTATKVITIKPYATLNGPWIGCENTPYPYVFKDPYGNTISTLNWIVKGPNNFTQNGTAGSFNFTFPTAGVYNFDFTAPGYCSSMSTVIIEKAIPAPTTISGPTVTCPGIPVTFSCTPHSGAVTHWQVINGTIAGGITTGNQISVNFSATATTPFVVRVWYVGDQCSSAVYSTTIGRDIPVVALQDGAATVCGSTSDTYTVNNVNAENYNWIISPPEAGSVESGQNTTSATILWNQAAMPATITVQVRKCGIVYDFHFPVTIISSPPLTVNIPPNICTGETMDFNFSLTPASTFTDITVNYGDSIETTLTYSQYMSNPNLLDHIYTDQIGNATAYTVTTTVRGAGGCPYPSHDVAQISVSPSPVITLSPTSNLNLCDLQNVFNPGNYTYTVDIQGGFGQTYTIQWHKDTDTNIISTNATINAQQLGIGTYWATVTNNFGCKKDTPHFLVHSDCSSCSTTSTVAATAVNTYCGKVEATLTVGDPNAIDIYWGNVNLPGAVVDANTTSSFIAHNIEPGEYNLTINADYMTDNGVCTSHHYVPFIIPYKAGIKHNITCDNNGLYSVQLLDHSVFFPDTPITSFEFTVNNGTTWFPGTLSGSTYSYLAHLAPGIHQVGIRIGRSGYPSCQEIISLALPDYPIAAFSSDVACFGTSTQFTVAPNTQSDLEYEWTFVPDMTNNLQQNPVKTFGGTGPFAAILKVTNKYGCSATVTHSVSIQSINMAGSISATPALACQGSNMMLNFTPAPGSTAPHHLIWYKNSVNSPSIGTSVYPQGISVNSAGSYFASAVDANGCEYQTAAITTQFIPTPNAPVIQGTGTICEGASAHVYVAQDANIRYVWTLDGAAMPSWTNLYDVYPQFISPGTHTVTATPQTQPSGGTSCAGPTASFTITVNPVPEVPEITFVVEKCEPYLVKVMVSNPQSGVGYYWSNGTTGESTTMTHDGPIQVRAVLDGCMSSNQIDLPLDLQSVAWVFPDGCYEVCKEENAGYLIGPPGENYTYTWFEDGTAVSSGSGPVLPYYGLGGVAHDYELFLATDYCDKTLSLLDVIISDKCPKCDIKPDIREIRGRKEGELCWYDVMFTFDNTTGVNVFATFTAANGEGFFSPGTLILAPGVSTQLVQFFAANGYTGGTIAIEIHGTSSKGECLSVLDSHFPELCQTDRPAPNRIGITERETIFVVAPNPAAELSTLYYQFANTSGEKLIEIYDMLGRLLYGFKPGAEGSTVLDCSKYGEGSYLILMKQDQQVIRQLKFMVSKQ